MKLYIGSKNYSSWSMRPWVLLRQFGIEFEEVLVRFDSFAPDSSFKQTIDAVSPTGRVPVLVDDDAIVYDSLAIAEYLAERFPQLALWPADRVQRARARSACAEMHSSFTALRTLCPMNIEAELADVGAIIVRDHADVRADVDRLVELWGGLLQAGGGPMLFGEFGIIDAYFAPVGSRITTYALPVPPAIADYIARVQALPGVAAWYQQARAETDFRPFEEPYRVRR